MTQNYRQVKAFIFFHLLPAYLLQPKNIFMESSIFCLENFDCDSNRISVCSWIFSTSINECNFLKESRWFNIIDISKILFIIFNRERVILKTLIEFREGKPNITDILIDFWFQRKVPIPLVITLRIFNLIRMVFRTIWKQFFQES
jgi:hypothetical protein